MQIDILAQIAEQKDSLVQRLNEELAFEEQNGYVAVDTKPLFDRLRVLERTAKALQELYAGEVQQLRWC